MKYFDKIYCINIVNATKRRELMEDQFNRIFPEEDIQFWETVKKTFLNNESARCIIQDRIGNTTTDGIKLPIIGSYYEWYMDDNKNIMGVLYDCAYQVYSILKIAQVKQYDHICIFEDDFTFIDDTNIITQLLDKMPDDYDMIRFYSSGYSNENEKIDYISFKDINNPYDLNMFNGGIGMLALSQKGIQFYIDMLEQDMFVSDMPLMDFSKWQASDLKCYRPLQLLYKPDYNNEKIESTVLTCKFD